MRLEISAGGDLQESAKFSSMRTGEPFYWTAPADTGCAETGWYQWTKTGLIYLGPSIPYDELAEDEQFGVDVRKEV